LGVENLAADPVAAGLELREDLQEVAFCRAFHEARDVLGDECPRTEAIQQPDELEE
jgi:hypothetical protein